MKGLLFFLVATLVAAAPAVDLLDMRLMTYNIRVAADKLNQGEESWSIRRPLLTSQLKKETADHNETLMCLQEAVHQQVKDVQTDLGKDWAYIGVGRDDGKAAGEFAPIFYHKAQWDLVDNFTVWLSEEPTKAGSKGWGAKIPRLMTIGRFQHVARDTQIFYMCTHFDHESEKVQQNSAHFLHDVPEVYLPGAVDPPVFLGGDFNLKRNTSGYEMLLNRFSDVKDLVGKDHQSGDGITYTGFGPAKKTDKPPKHALNRRCMLPNEATVEEAGCGEDTASQPPSNAETPKHEDLPTDDNAASPCPMGDVFTCYNHDEEGRSVHGDQQGEPQAAESGPLRSLPESIWTSVFSRPGQATSRGPDATQDANTAVESGSLHSLPETIWTSVFRPDKGTSRAPDPTQVVSTTVIVSQAPSSQSTVTEVLTFMTTTTKFVSTVISTGLESSTIGSGTSVSNTPKPSTSTAANSSKPTTSTAAKSSKPTTPTTAKSSKPTKSTTTPTPTTSKPTSTASKPTPTASKPAEAKPTGVVDHEGTTSEPKEVDYIFVLDPKPKGMEWLSYRVVDNRAKDGVYISDHRMVVVDFKMPIRPYAEEPDEKPGKTKSGSKAQDDSSVPGVVPLPGGPKGKPTKTPPKGKPTKPPTKISQPEKNPKPDVKLQPEQKPNEIQIGRAHV